VRIKKLEELGVVSGKRLNVNLKQLGYDITALLDLPGKKFLYDGVARIYKHSQIVRLNYTTGNYSMFIEIVCKNIEE
jgi:Lrp/AsnC family transcriptional regulator for asnA, asnC and gidA